MRAFTAAAKALSDEHRARAVLFLQAGELCLCQIVEMLGLAPSTVSKHMSVLFQAGLVESRKEGRWVYYRLAGDGATSCARAAVAFARACLTRDPRIVEDRRRLAAVRQMTMEALCCRYRT